MVKKNIFQAILIFAFAFLTINSSITIVNPVELQKLITKPIEGKYSVFGSYKYGFTERAELSYHSNNEKLLQQDKDYACKDLPKLDEKQTNVAVLIDRGDCSFVTKVRNVQNIGGKIAIIINNKSDDNLIFAMNDDGTGKDIKIPGILISQENGQKLKQFLKENPNSKVEISFDNSLDNLKQKIDFNINFIANDRKVYSMLNQVSSFVNLLTKEQVLNFVPNYITVPHPEYGIVSNFVKDNSNCICGGRYCSYGHNFFQDSFLNTINNQQVIVESIRQKCIFNLEGVENYVNYMKSFSTSCLNENNFNLGCSKQVLKDLKLNQNNKVEQCYLNSFKLNKEVANNKAVTEDTVTQVCSSNDILEGDRTRNEIKEILPVIFINNHTLFGTWNQDNVLEALCANMKNKPEVCFASLTNVFEETGFKLTNTQLVVFAVFLILINLTLFVLCKRYTSRKEYLVDDSLLDKKIGNIVNGYLKLKDQK